MLSVNTNVGAMIALQYLNKTTAELGVTQNHINSGLKIASAKDNGAVFAIAQNMRGNVSAFHAVSDSLNRGVSAIDVAMSAGQAISDLLDRNEGKSRLLRPTFRSTRRAAMRWTKTSNRCAIRSPTFSRTPPSTASTSRTARPPASGSGVGRWCEHDHDRRRGL